MIITYKDEQKCQFITDCFLCQSHFTIYLYHRPNILKNKPFKYKYIVLMKPLLLSGAAAAYIWVQICPNGSVFTVKPALCTTLDEPTAVFAADVG